MDFSVGGHHNLFKRKQFNGIVAGVAKRWPSCSVEIPSPISSKKDPDSLASIVLIDIRSFVPLSIYIIHSKVSASILKIRPQTFW